MDEKLEEAINAVLAKIRANMGADEYLKVSQAVLNLAHARQLLVSGKK